MSGRRIAALVGAGLALLVLGALLYVLAVYINLGLQLNESGTEHVSKAWAAPLAWTGIVLALGGPTIFWVIIPLVHLRRR